LRHQRSGETYHEWEFPGIPPDWYAGTAILAVDKKGKVVRSGQSVWVKPGEEVTAVFGNLCSSGNALVFLGQMSAALSRLDYKPITLSNMDNIVWTVSLAGIKLRVGTAVFLTHPARAA